MTSSSSLRVCGSDQRSGLHDGGRLCNGLTPVQICTKMHCCCTHTVKVKFLNKLFI